MASTMTYEYGNATVAGLGWLGQMRKALADHRLYRRTLAELEALNDRELADLGLSRLAIREVAHDSVYGA
jgi:uncharacterized protein YjiS (DUF1127 family)